MTAEAERRCNSRGQSANVPAIHAASARYPRTPSTGAGTFDALNRRVELGSGLSYERMMYPPFAPTTRCLPDGGQAIFNGSVLAQYRHPNWQGSETVMSYPTDSPSPSVGGAFTPFGEKYAIYPGRFNGYFAGMLGIADEGAIADAYQATARLYHAVS